MTWGPERIETIRIWTTGGNNPELLSREDLEGGLRTAIRELREALDHIEAQQEELEAVWRVVEICNRRHVSAAEIRDAGMETVTVQMDAAVIHGLRWALERYDAAREAGGEEASE